MKTAIGVKLAVLLHRLWVSGEVYEPLRNSQKAMNESRTPNWHRAKIAHIRVRMEGWRQRRLGWIGTDSRKEESESATGLAIVADRRSWREVFLWKTRRMKKEERSKEMA
jgi:hypothetical protein